MSAYRGLDSDVRKAHYTTTEVLRLLLMSRSTLLKRIDNGHFPKPHKMQGCLYFRKAEVDQWLEENPMCHRIPGLLGNPKMSDVNLTVRITRKDDNDIDEACRILGGCDRENFIRDAIVWKTQFVLKS